MPDERHSAFGDFLRSRREKLEPKSVGAAGLRRRRTPGLRREEVAERAGIGVDWYIRLEQGRTVSPSAATVDALARALRLSRAEHVHLRALASGGDRRAFAREVVPDALRRMVAALKTPAYVTGRRWDLLAWNEAAAQVFTDLAASPAAERNILLHVLASRPGRALFGDAWEAEARRMTAQFRATHDLWAGDPAFQDLLARLRAGCPEFAGWWESHDVRATAGGSKTLHHPALGVLRFEHASFQSNDDPALKLVVYTPVEVTAATPPRSSSGNPPCPSRDTP